MESLGHATAASDTAAPSGKSTIDHVEPSQCSTNEPRLAIPIAKQLEMLEHESPTNAEKAPASGVATVDQLCPFHRANTGLMAAEVNRRPTAKQVVGAGHATPSKAVCPVSTGNGATDHWLPFQRRTRECGGPDLRQ